MIIVFLSAAFKAASGPATLLVLWFWNSNPKKQGAIEKNELKFSALCGLPDSCKIVARNDENLIHESRYPWSENYLKQKTTLNTLKQIPELPEMIETSESPSMKTSGKDFTIWVGFPTGNEKAKNCFTLHVVSWNWEKSFQWLSRNLEFSHLSSNKNELLAANPTTPNRKREKISWFNPGLGVVRTRLAKSKDCFFYNHQILALEWSWVNYT